MPLADSQDIADQAGPSRRNVSVGDPLFLVIESVSGDGGKTFEGRMRFPLSGQGRQVLVRIGVYGRGEEVLPQKALAWDRVRP